MGFVASVNGLYQSPPFEVTFWQLPCKGESISSPLESGLAWDSGFDQ